LIDNYISINDLNTGGILKNSDNILPKITDLPSIFLIDHNIIIIFGISTIGGPTAATNDFTNQILF
jgi:hypothetical protein